MKFFATHTPGEDSKLDAELVLNALTEHHLATKSSTSETEPTRWTTCIGAASSPTGPAVSPRSCCSNLKDAQSGRARVLRQIKGDAALK